MSTTPTPPPQIALLGLLSGYWISQAIHVAARLGIADMLKDSPKDVDELAKLAQAHAPAVYRLLRALASVGVFAEVGERTFGNTPLSDCLRGDVPNSQRSAAVSMGEEHYRTWGELLYSVQTGGNGSLLCATLQRHPRLHAILFDRPDVIERAKANLTAAGVADRCQTVAGNFFVGVPAGGDAYLLRHIIHDWYDPESRSILSNIRKVIPPNGKLLLVESVIPPGNEPFFGKFLDLTMLVIPGGMERTEAEYRELLKSVGFTLQRIMPTRSEISVIESTPS